MLLKVCGLKQSLNIQEINETINPDMMGFIFYPKSKRFVGDRFVLPNDISAKKVGVFVNEKVEKVINTYHEMGLHFVQLHGGESYEYCQSLRAEGLKVIKVFSIGKELPVRDLEEFQMVADMYLFDTKTSDYGGSGKKFNWELLLDYNFEKDYLLSGGISLEDLGSIQSLTLPRMVGIDVNSQFEDNPGFKNIKLLSKLKGTMNGY